jgi:hypothetical protein
VPDDRGVRRSRRYRGRAITRLSAVPVESPAGPPCWTMPPGRSWCWVSIHVTIRGTEFATSPPWRPPWRLGCAQPRRRSTASRHCRCQRFARDVGRTDRDVVITFVCNIILTSLCLQRAKPAIYLTNRSGPRPTSITKFNSHRYCNVLCDRYHLLTRRDVSPRPVGSLLIEAVFQGQKTLSVDVTCL